MICEAMAHYGISYYFLILLWLVILHTVDQRIIYLGCYAKYFYFKCWIMMRCGPITAIVPLKSETNEISFKAFTDTTANSF